LPALSLAVTDSTLPAFCLEILTENLPDLLAVAVPITLLPTFTVTFEPASAFPVTFVDLTVTLSTFGVNGAVLSTTFTILALLILPALSIA
jgi:hypothetical protein